HHSRVFAGNLGDDGYNPFTGLLAGRDGALYGTTSLGGVSGDNGTVFEVKPPAIAGGAWRYKILYSFSGMEVEPAPAGALPEGALIADAQGALYGPTLGGGASSLGTVFALTPPIGSGPWTESVLHSFAGGADDGDYPAGRSGDG
ncbi:MAG: choice-of-anchor tandem repeat GloVer-containing protein, partial [Steroidobacteraceae bacterium]